MYCCKYKVKGVSVTNQHFNTVFQKTEKALLKYILLQKLLKKMHFQLNIENNNKHYYFK